MRIGPITATAQHLMLAQCRLQALQCDQHSRRRTPDGFSAELHAERAGALLLAQIECWHLSAFLPTDAANDGTTLPGAA